MPIFERRLLEKHENIYFVITEHGNLNLLDSNIKVLFCFIQQKLHYKNFVPVSIFQWRLSLFTDCKFIPLQAVFYGMLKLASVVFFVGK